MPLFGIGHYLFLDLACRAFGSCGEWQVEILQQPFQAWVRQARYQSPLQERAMSLSLLKFVWQASLVDEAMLPS